MFSPGIGKHGYPVALTLQHFSGFFELVNQFFLVVAIGHQVSGIDGVRTDFVTVSVQFVQFTKIQVDRIIVEDSLRNDVKSSNCSVFSEDAVAVGEMILSAVIKINDTGSLRNLFAFQNIVFHDVTESKPAAAGSIGQIVDLFFKIRNVHLQTGTDDLLIVINYMVVA